MIRTAATAATAGMATEGVPQVVAERWGFAELTLRPLTGGLINQTFAALRDGEPVAVLQRLHAIFAPEVNLDIEALTAHLAARALTTPRLLRTGDGAAWVVDPQGQVWRALTWAPGRCVARVPDARWAEAGGELVGRFHRAVADFAHEYHFRRAGVHDTAAHLERLRGWVEHPPPSRAGPADLLPEARALGRDVLATAARLAPLPRTPPRHCHGDLKISNLLFTEHEPLAGSCLVDLDTIGLGTIAFELGDAMRSWCNPRGEDERAAAFELPLFAAAVRGFRRRADDLLSDDERRSIPAGLATVTVELAARFCVDVFEDRYFGWDADRFASRREHNLVRARGQLSLAHAILTQLEDATEIACGAAHGR